MQVGMTVSGVTFGLLLCGALACPAAIEAQGPNGRWPLQPKGPGGRTLAPFMEGWYANENGTYSISFGYLNLNQDTLEIPVGEDNFLEPAEYMLRARVDNFRAIDSASGDQGCWTNGYVRVTVR